MAGLSSRREPGRVRNPRAEYYAWKMEETERLFDELRTLSESGVPIIVEGRRDEAALRKLGVRGRIYCLKARGESRHDFLERLNGSSEAILLTDFDREGKKLETWLYKELSQMGVKSDLRLWSRMRSLARTEVRSVEELPSFVRALEHRAIGIRPLVARLPRK
ncbi:toprim domain-containing protein [Candidatus Bathyarchaeota archaeon]|nr:MAG: toprim domain-containing protein [Candidatus Bathyarchaeota archaeon]TMI52028.1 MAG: toprim domain-containing protein [Candidatus Bathyarchaeota archaeon]